MQRSDAYLICFSRQSFIFHKFFIFFHCTRFALKCFAAPLSDEGTPGTYHHQTSAGDDTPNCGPSSFPFDKQHEKYWSARKCVGRTYTAQVCRGSSTLENSERRCGHSLVRTTAAATTDVSISNSAAARISRTEKPSITIFMTIIPSPAPISRQSHPPT